LYLFQNAFEFFRFGHACAMAWLLFLITLVATYGVWKLTLSKAFQEA
jgi:ABC-type sugar transport system permease subunit